MSHVIGFQKLRRFIKIQNMNKNKINKKKSNLSVPETLIPNSAMVVKISKQKRNTLIL